MTRDFFKTQNTEENLLKMKALRNLHFKAEKLLKIEIFIGGLLIGSLYFLLPLSAPYIFSFFKINYSIIQPFIGFFTPLLSLIFTLFDLSIINPRITNIKRKTASLLEEFDGNVLQLPWNKIKINHINEEEILYNAQQYQEKSNNTESLKNWYPEIIDKLPLPIGRILAQKTNCWWENNLRENYIKILKIGGLFILVLVVISTIYVALNNQTLINGIRTLIYGLLSFLFYYVFLMRQINDHNNSRKRLSRLMGKIEVIWKDILDSKSQNLDVLSRQIQDEIFDFRKTTPIIFDWFYNYEKKKKKISAAEFSKKKVEEYFSKRNI